MQAVQFAVAAWHALALLIGLGREVDKHLPPPADPPAIERPAEVPEDPAL